jgi:hypothetical protein
VARAKSLFDLKFGVGSGVGVRGGEGRVVCLDEDIVLWLDGLDDGLAIQSVTGERMFECGVVCMCDELQRCEKWRM